MAAAEHVHDVVVIGASVAGASAAALLAASERDVLLLEDGRLQDLPSRTTLMSPHCGPILERAGVGAASLEAEQARTCQLYHADFTKRIRPNLPAEKVSLVEEAALVRGLVQAAVRHDCATLLEGSVVTRISAGEDDVTLTLENGHGARGRLVLLATAAGSPLAEQVGLVLDRSAGGLWSASYCCPGGDTASDGSIDFILGLGSGEGIGYRLCHGGELTLGVCVQESAARAVADLMHISTKLVELGQVPPQWQTHAAGTGARWSPAGGALEMDTHVGKRIVAAGEVGGFVASYTNESTYPGMWAADLACVTIERTLGSAQPQDELRDYDRVWRTTMAEYLRPPNTDAQSLLPLVFSNQQMADKMVESLLLGANF